MKWPWKKKSRKPRQTRAYQMAAMGRLTADWNANVGSANSEIIPKLRTMRSRSRDLYQNNDYAKRFTNLVKTNVLGPKGILLQNRAVDANGELDKVANDLIKKRWEIWGRKGSATMCGAYSFLASCGVVLDRLVVDGEVLIQKVRGGENGFSTHFIESDMLDDRLNDPDHNIFGGVETDEWGRPVAYHFFSSHPNEYPGTSIMRDHKRVLAEEIIHVFVKERPGQTRGVPWFVTPATRLKMLGAFEEAELVASRVAAAKMGFFTTPDGESYVPDDVEDDGEGGSTLITEASPGTFEELPEGTDFKPWDPTHPNTAFESFMKSILRGISSGLNVSYISLANDLTGVSYSSIRQGELSDRDTWRMIQSFLIENYISEVFESWLPMELLSGALKLPARKLDKFNQPYWMPRGWKWVDPQKEIKANIEGIRNGLGTIAGVLAESGQTVEDVFDQLAYEKELAEDRGLDLPVLFGEPGDDDDTEGNDDGKEKID